MRRFFLLALGLLLAGPTVRAQSASFDSLVYLPSTQLQVYHSKGRASRAAEIVPRVEKAMKWYGDQYGFKPRVKLLILTEADWPGYTSFPVYGMPHYDDKETLIVAADDNEFWRNNLPDLAAFPDSVATAAQQVYSQDGSGMKAFFDLLALHELGHAFHFQAGLQVQRLWMGELLVNMMLHCYVAEQEPEQLAALTLFPRMVVMKGSEGFPFQTLQQLQENYVVIGQQHPYNYAWYQCRWHKAAAELYNQYGCELVKKTWNWLKQKDRIGTDDELIRFFEKGNLEGLANFMRKW
jgi:hypothetical protein